MARGVRGPAHHPAIRLAGNRASEFPFSVSGSSFLCRYGCPHRFGLGKEYVEARLENCGGGLPVHVHCPGRHGHAPQWRPPERYPRSPGNQNLVVENRLCRHAQIAMDPGGPDRNRRAGAGAPGRRNRTGRPITGRPRTPSAHPDRQPGRDCSIGTRPHRRHQPAAAERPDRIERTRIAGRQPLRVAIPMHRPYIWTANWSRAMPASA